MRYLSQDSLTGLKSYHYKTAGYTWLDDAHQPFWNWLVSQLPLWFAPNLITLLGLLGVVAGYYVIAVFQPQFNGESPGWAYILAGVSVIAYANLDCIDGKQARRTRTSSPLGQLFDHGCDAYIVHLMIGDMLACTSVGCGWRTTIGSFWIMAPWIFAQLEEYHTGVMLYGNGLWGVLEALYVTAGFSIATGVTGADYWRQSIHFLPEEWDIGPSTTFTLDSLIQTMFTGLVDVFLGFVFLSGTTQIIGQMWRILVFRTDKMPKTERGRKALGIWNALWHFLLIFILLISGSIWLLTARDSTCRLAFTTFGTVYAFFATELIIAHMAKTEFNPFSWYLIALVFLGFNSAWLKLYSLWVAAIACFICNVAYVHYTIIVVRQLCAFLDINCLTIKKH